jgi:hypothetical protein
MLTERASEHIQHMQKALVLMNVRLDQAVSDITGVTGMKILRAILEGKRDPKELAQLRDPACAKSEEQIAEALTGHYREEQLFALKQSVQLWDFHRDLIQQCDNKMQAVIEKLPIKVDATTVPKARGKRGKPRKNEVQFDARTLLYERLGLDLTQIAGLHVLTILTIISECGHDLSRFPTGKHFWEEWSAREAGERPIEPQPRCAWLLRLWRIRTRSWEPSTAARRARSAPQRRLTLPRRNWPAASTTPFARDALTPIVDSSSTN